MKIIVDNFLTGKVTELLVEDSKVFEKVKDTYDLPHFICKEVSPLFEDLTFTDKDGINKIIVSCLGDPQIWINRERFKGGKCEITCGNWEVIVGEATLKDVPPIGVSWKKSG